MLDIGTEWYNQKIELLIPFVQAIKGYFVGGCVRDLLLKQPIGDIDLATSLTVEELLEQLDSRGIFYEKSLEFPVFSLEVEGIPVEVALFRRENYPSVGARSCVEWESRGVTLKEDAYRRDFTINALYLSGDLELIDPTGWELRDLKSKKIHFIGDPEKRLEEDPLRLLRGIRFYGFAGFSFEKETKKAIVKRLDLLSRLGKNLIYLEFEKIIKIGDKCTGFMTEEGILPSLNYGYVEEDAKGIVAVGQFLLEGSISDITWILTHYTPFSKKEKELIEKTIPYCRKYIRALTKEDLEKVFISFSKCFKERQEFLEAVCYLEAVLGDADVKAYEEASILVLYTEDLAISGEDVLAENMGYSGKEVGDLLENLLRKVQRKEVKNTREELLKLL